MQKFSNKSSFLISRMSNSVQFCFVCALLVISLSYFTDGINAPSQFDSVPISLMGPKFGEQEAEEGPEKRKKRCETKCPDDNVEPKAARHDYGEDDCCSEGGAEPKSSKFGKIEKFTDEFAPKPGFGQGSNPLFGQGRKPFFDSSRKPSGGGGQGGITCKCDCDGLPLF